MDAPRTGLSTALAALGILLVALAVHLGYAALYETPLPESHDEFAYLLSADTFASGRLTNPTHPEWEHFETFHVFHHPTYQCKYPPAQGLALALGKLLGHPIFGVWLILGLAYASLFWMLRALLPPGWAVLGVLLVLVDVDFLRTWGQTYWGGGVAFLGGNLLVGGVVRTWKGPRAIDAWVCGVGLWLLANSRPVEGVILAAMSACLLFVTIGRARRAQQPIFRPLILPLGISAVLVLGWILYYNQAVVENPLRMVYLNWYTEGNVTEHVRAYRGSADMGYVGEAIRLTAFYLSYPLLLVLPFLLFRPSRRVVINMAAVGFALVVSTLISRAWPHYVAPYTCLMVWLLVEALRTLSGISLRGLAVGRWAALAIVLAHVGDAGYELAGILRWGPPDNWARQRARMVERLHEDPDRHLILLRYGEEHNIHEEWVYNAADIDAAKIVWAIELGPEKDASLFEAFAGHKHWLIESPAETYELVPYPR